MNKQLRNNLICSCDNLVDILTKDKNSFGFSKMSAKTRWEEKLDDNYYFSHISQSKRAKKYHNKLKKYWSDVELKIITLYKKRKNIKFLFLNQALSKRTKRTDEDLNDNEWSDIIRNAVVMSFFFDFFDKTFVNELNIAYIEVIRNLNEIDGVNVVATGTNPRLNVILKFKEYQRRLSNIIIKKRIQSLKDITIYGVEDGLTDNEIIKSIKKKIKRIKDFDSARVVRTETSRAGNLGIMNAYKDSNIKKYMILTALRACPICIDRALGNPYTVGDTYGLPLFHVNCRCITIPYYNNL